MFSIRKLDGLILGIECILAKDHSSLSVNQRETLTEAVNCLKQLRKHPDSSSGEQYLYEVCGLLWSVIKQIDSIETIINLLEDIGMLN